MNAFGRKPGYPKRRYAGRTSRLHTGRPQPTAGQNELIKLMLFAEIDAVNMLVFYTAR